MTNKIHMFNTTRIMLQMYEQGFPMSKEMFSLLDTDEISNLTVRIEVDGRPLDYPVNGTLHENMIEHLPFQAYEQVLSEEFLKKYGKNNRTLMHTAMYHKRFEYVEYCLNFGDIILQENNEKNFYNERTLTYFRQVLEPLLTLNNILNWGYSTSLTHVKEYQHAFYRGLKQHEAFSELFSQAYGKKNKNYKKWFVNQENIFSNLSRNPEKKDIIHALIENSIFMPIIEDIYTQYNNANNPFNSAESFKRALLHDNIEFIQFINQKQDNEYDMKTMIGTYLERVFSNFTSDSNSKSFQDTKVFPKVWKTLNFLKATYPQAFSHYQNKAPLGLLRFTSNEIEQLETLFPNLKSAPCFQGLNYYEMIQVGREIHTLGQECSLNYRYHMKDIFDYLKRYNPDSPETLNVMVFDFIEKNQKEIFADNNGLLEVLAANRLEGLLPNATPRRKHKI